MWIECTEGHTHWGAAGAAGLLLVSADPQTDEEVILLQHRAEWVHQGDTWGIPGGAIDHSETPLEGARREAEEEMGEFGGLVVMAEYVEDHGNWAYTTIVARVPYFTPVICDEETGEGGFRWVSWREATDSMDLHPGLADAMPHLRSQLV